MAKILLVEDDQSLREIYSIRLTAEGYEIFSAGDGEEALAIAVREKPDLVLSDVMMPKISGFDMLDILRQTPETKDIKVIMMTALSSEDQRERGNALGADRYLVKSQVGIEDVVNAVHEVLESNNAPAATPEAASTPAPAAPAAPATPPAPAAPTAPVAPAPEPTPGQNIQNML
ncbi:response regulator [Candidatus Saccharibacteria bacterium]|nr:response regulator [Candidatus Saccharibacteria bacterium]